MSDVNAAVEMPWQTATMYGVWQPSWQAVWCLKISSFQNTSQQMYWDLSATTTLRGKLWDLFSITFHLGTLLEC
jgi:hypothetical protein